MRKLLGIIAVLALLACTGGEAVLAQSLPGVSAPVSTATTSAESPDALSSQQAAKALIEILDDEAARSRLIGELGRIAAGGVVADTADVPVVTDIQSLESSLARELGAYTQGMTREVLEFVSRIWLRLSNLADVVTGRATIDWQTLKDQLRALAVVAGAAFAALWLTRLLARWPLDAVAGMAVGRGVLARLGLLSVVAVVEVLCLAVAWAASLATVASLAAASDGRVGFIEGIFANAFAIVELTKIAIRLLFTPRRPSLRPIPVSDASARYWSFSLARLADVLGYGVLLVAPMLTSSISFAVGIGVRLAVVLIALLGWIALVMRNRQGVRAGLADVASKSTSVTVTTTLTLLAPIWHILAIGYAAIAFIVWVSRPFDAIGFMVTATVESAIILTVGGGLMAMIARGIAGGVRLPADVKSLLPLLESRLNLLVPSILRVLRILMAAILVAGVFHAWEIVDIFEWAASEAGSVTLGRLSTAFAILAIAMAIWIAATSWIEYRLNPVTGHVSTPRARTLLSLFRNAFTILLLVIATMLALSELGVDIAPLIAGAGVLGLAIGFGSQKLVQDIINGAFIQLENAMNEGDVVTVAGITGVVERLTIRSVGLRDLTGVYHIIPFSSVDSVSNFMRGFAFHVSELRVARDEDTDRVKGFMSAAFDKLMKTEHQADILEPLDMQGVVDFVDGAVLMRARIKTLPGKQWSVGRAYNEIVKRVFNENDIALPAAPASEWIQSLHSHVIEPGRDEETTTLAGATPGGTDRRT